MQLKYKIILALIFYAILIYYFTGCAPNNIETSPYCADERSEYTEKCTHTCDGQWVRVIGETVFYFDNEKQCLGGE
jgi:hypothetical protein